MTVEIRPTLLRTQFKLCPFLFLKEKDMNIQTILISEINAAKYNPRKDLKPNDPEFKKLKDSIERWDLVEPLVVNQRTNTLISGHQRLKVCKILGMTEVQAVMVDLSPQREKLLNMSLNKNGSDWDYIKLEELFKEFNPDELTITGFDDDEIKKIAAFMDDIEADNNKQDITKITSSASEVKGREEKTEFKTVTETAEATEAVKDEKFTVYIPFNDKDKANEWLEREGFKEKFNNNTMINIHMGEYNNEN